MKAYFVPWGLEQEKHKFDASLHHIRLFLKIQAKKLKNKLEYYFLYSEHKYVYINCTFSYSQINLKKPNVS